MSTTLSWALVAGLGLGIGLWLIVSRLPHMRATTLASRVVPFITDVSAEAYATVSRERFDPLPVVGISLWPAVTMIRRLMAGVFGSGTALQQRLKQAGETTTVERFRFAQLGWSTATAAATIVVIVASPVLADAAITVHISLTALAAMTAFITYDQMLRARITRRAQRIRSELPTILEFLALSVSAGENLRDAIDRVATIGHGELSRELSLVSIEATTGVPFAAALRRLADDLHISSVTRAVDAMAASLERGSPISEVLRAHSSDARQTAKNDLIEAAGKKELAMLVPLVFLILPVTVLFAVYPGIFVLEAGFGT